MLCPICNKNEGEWQCQVCRRIVCTNDARPTSSGVFCIEHSPQFSSKPQQAPTGFRNENSSLSGVKTAFFTVLFLTLGMAFIVFIGGQFVNKIDLPEAAQSAVDALNSVGMLVLAAMGFITFILGAAYIALRRHEQ